MAPRPRLACGSSAWTTRGRVSARPCHSLAARWRARSPPRRRWEQPVGARDQRMEGGRWRLPPHGHPLCVVPLRCGAGGPPREVVCSVLRAVPVEAWSSGAGGGRGCNRAALVEATTRGQLPSSSTVGAGVPSDLRLSAASHIRPPRLRPHPPQATLPIPPTLPISRSSSTQPVSPWLAASRVGCPSSLSSSFCRCSWRWSRPRRRRTRLSASAAPGRSAAVASRALAARTSTSASAFARTAFARARPPTAAATEAAMRAGPGAKPSS